MTFKQSEIKPCAVCRKVLMHAGIPLFYRVQVERLGFDLRAVQRQHGLELMMGRASPLAAIMGPDEDMAKVIDESRTILICETCTHEHPVLMKIFLGWNDQENG